MTDPATGSGRWRVAAGFALVSALLAWTGLLGAASAEGPSPAANSTESPAAAKTPDTQADTTDLIFLSAARPIIIRLHLSVDGRRMADLRSAIARRIFDTLDANKNGVLDGNELKNLPTPQMLATAGRDPEAPAETAPAETTAAAAPLVPKDGRVTPETWTRFLFPPTGGPLTRVTFAAPPPAMRAVGGDMETPTGGDLAALLSAIDADGDGRLSAAELSHVDGLFRLLDLNDDEQVSRSEFVAPIDARWASNPTQGGSTGPLLPLEPISHRSENQAGDNARGDNSALIRRLLQTFAPKIADPKSVKPEGKPKAPAKPMGIPLEVFAPSDDAARFDKNADGLLDEHEIEAWLADPRPQAELAVDLVMTSLKESQVRPLKVLPMATAAGLAIETPSPGRVLLRVGPAPLDLQAADAPRRAAARTSRYRSMFKRADQNKNNYLETSEIPFLGQGLDSRDFEAMDRDHNGMVFEDEWIAYLRLRDALAEGRLSLTISVESVDPLTQFDANRDGRLNRAEFAAALAAVAAWDRNHDGFVTPDEIPRTLLGTFHIGPTRSVSLRGPRYSRMKASSKPQPASDAPVWFQRMDRNQDGEVSLREFLGPISVFRRLDTNGDGRLDVHEAQAAQK
jgi:Ca2+-binding EF-hand superfamily protein